MASFFFLFVPFAAEAWSFESVVEEVELESEVEEDEDFGTASDTFFFFSFGVQTCAAGCQRA